MNNQDDPNPVTMVDMFFGICIAVLVGTLILVAFNIASYTTVGYVGSRPQFDDSADCMKNSEVRPVSEPVGPAASEGPPMTPSVEIQVEQRLLQDDLKEIQYLIGMPDSSDGPKEQPAGAF